MRLLGIAGLSLCGFACNFHGLQVTGPKAQNGVKVQGEDTSKNHRVGEECHFALEVGWRKRQLDQNGAELNN